MSKDFPQFAGGPTHGMKAYAWFEMERVYDDFGGPVERRLHGALRPP